jgi:hypothetical protein
MHPPWSKSSKIQLKGFYIGLQLVAPSCATFLSNSRREIKGYDKVTYHLTVLTNGVHGRSWVSVITCPSFPSSSTSFLELPLSCLLPGCSAGATWPGTAGTDSRTPGLAGSRVRCLHVVSVTVSHVVSALVILCIEQTGTSSVWRGHCKPSISSYFEGVLFSLNSILSLV